jgi:hypothetical protein
MSAVSHFRFTKVYQAGQPPMNRFARVLLCKEGTVSVSKPDVDVPFDSGSLAIEVNIDATAISEPHLATRQPSYRTPGQAKFSAQQLNEEGGMARWKNRLPSMRLEVLCVAD